MVSSAATSISRIDPQDAALMRRVAAGDSLALEVLYRNYTPRLMNYLWSKLGQAALAEEVCQDVWIIVWKKAPQFKPLGPLSTWLFGIAQRLARKARTQHVNRDREAVSDPETEEESPEAFLCRQSRHRQVTQAVAALSPVLRQTVTLRYDHGNTYREIAVRMGCAEGTVKARLQQARRRLGVSLRRLDRPVIITV